MGMVLFIVSEVMFFLPFLSLFHSSMAPAIEIGGVWPPLGIETFSP
jgi:cytochrome c oxidase subunit 3